MTATHFLTCWKGELSTSLYLLTWFKCISRTAGCPKQQKTKPKVVSSVGPKRLKVTTPCQCGQNADYPRMDFLSGPRVRLRRSHFLNLTSWPPGHSCPALWPAGMKGLSQPKVTVSDYMCMSARGILHMLVSASRGRWVKCVKTYRSASGNLVWNNTVQLRIMWTIGSAWFGHAGTDQIIQVSRKVERGRRKWRGIMSSHNPPFDTTREALVSLNNPCCSIKFAD